MSLNFSIRQLNSIFLLLKKKRNDDAIDRYEINLINIRCDMDEDVGKK